MARNTALAAVFAGLTLSLVWVPAFAQEFVATHGDWSVFTISQGAGNTCYIASAPVKKTGNYSKRGDAYVLITHRGSTTDEASVSSGYPYKGETAVKIEVDANKFEFFAKDQIAWAYDEAQDAAVVKAMKKGSRMVVKGISAKGTNSVDTYSLKGVTAAYNQMKSLCR